VGHTVLLLENNYVTSSEAILTGLFCGHDADDFVVGAFCGQAILTRLHVFCLGLI